MNNWYNIETAIQMAKMMKDLENELMWGTSTTIDARTPTKKIKDFLRNSLKK